jgi:hypothetical protein
VKSRIALVIRRATVDDLDPIVAMATARRTQLAVWEDVYWKPRDGINEHHPLYLRWCIEHNPRCEVFVATEGDSVVGCVFVVALEGQWFLDDFCVAEERWTDVGQQLIRAFDGAPKLICAPTKDRREDEWLQTSECTLVSSFYSLLVPGDRSSAGTETIDVPEQAYPANIEPAPRHVFGPIDERTERGLRTSTADGYALGSASVLPHAYDPGGPTTVVDRVVGSNRAGVVDTLCREAAKRGDAQVIFVVANGDHELESILTMHGATKPVNLWAKLT